MASPRMVTLSTYPLLTRSMNALNGICSLVPFVVWNRLQRRKTRTMITTQRSAVFTVEFNKYLHCGTMLPACHALNNEPYCHEILRRLAVGAGVHARSSAGEDARRHTSHLHSADIRQIRVLLVEFQAVAEEDPPMVGLENAEIGVQGDRAQRRAVDQGDQLETSGVLLPQLHEQIGFDDPGGDDVLQ